MNSPANCTEHPGSQVVHIRKTRMFLGQKEAATGRDPPWLACLHSTEHKHMVLLCILQPNCPANNNVNRSNAAFLCGAFPATPMNSA